jgi:tRNA/rRNA methyltransferase
MDAQGPFERFEVVLCGTSNPENLGAVARLMDNFGFSALTLVAPRARVGDPRAMLVARTARHHLEHARRCDTLADAVGGVSRVVGFTARSGDLRPSIEVRDALARVVTGASANERTALVFGPEDTGLSNEDADRCDVLATIPTTGPLASLNLGQAVAIALWEVTQLARGRAVRPRRSGGATRAEIEALLDHAFETLEAFSYFHDKDRARKRTHLRRVLASARLSREEVHGLHGLCRQGLWALEHARREETKKAR